MSAEPYATTVTARNGAVAHRFRHAVHYASLGKVRGMATIRDGKLWDLYLVPAGGESGRRIEGTNRKAVEEVCVALEAIGDSRQREEA